MQLDAYNYSIACKKTDTWIRKIYFGVTGVRGVLHGTRKLALELVRVLVRESKARLLGARNDDMLPLIMLVDRSDVDMPRTPRRDTLLMWWLGS